MRRRIAITGAVIGTAAGITIGRTVRWWRTWGVDPAEAARSLAGDDLVPTPTAIETRGITIDAPPEAVWPWLAQMGQDRGGFYSIEWLENLAGCRMQNADEIHPEWQHRDIGETVMLHPDTGMPVTRFEPNDAYGLEGWGTFVLEPLPGGRTRLVEQPADVPWASRLFYATLVQIPHFVMQQAMFRGLKQRAERTPQPGPERRSSSSSAAARDAASSAARSLAS